MDPQGLLEKKTILFRRYKDLTVEQQNALKNSDVESVQKRVGEKETITKQIQELDTKLVNEGIDQTSLEPLIEEVLELEKSITSEIIRQKTGLTKESGNLRKGQRAIKQYLQ